MSKDSVDDEQDWAGHPDIPVSGEELRDLIARDYSGGKWAWR